MADYVPVEFPKWVRGVVVETREEEEAVLDGRAEYRVTKSAAGETRELSGFRPKKTAVQPVED